MKLTQFVPAIWRDRANDVNHSFVVPEYMQHSAVPRVPSWFYNEQFFANLFNKNPFLDVDLDPDQAAVALFYENERRCKMLNERFAQVLRHERLHNSLLMVKKNVHDILGRHLNWPSKLRFTSGATTTTSRGASPLERMHKGGINSRLWAQLLSFGPPDPKFFLNPSIVVQDFVEGKTVLKTAKISRLVCPENSFDMFIQCGIADMAVARLAKTTGINMSASQDVHKALAWYGSQTGDITTDDLVSGSHFLYTAFVSFCLPQSWKTWMDASRSTAIKLNGCVTELEHYMPNGNGFCSVLQTIIFYSVIKAAIESTGDIFIPGTVHVYGDDLIYPVQYTYVVRKLMRAIGFITNEEKSFSTGFFRESCGGDYLNGHNIRPIYAKHKYDCSFEKTQLANQIVMRYRHVDSYHIRRFWSLLVRSIPTTERCWGPTAMGNQCLHWWTHKTNWCPRGFFRPDVQRRRLALARKRRVKPEFLSRKIATWRAEPKTLTSFDQLTNGGISGFLAQELIISGDMAGWGGHRVHYRKSEYSDSPKRNPGAFRGPIPINRYSKNTAIFALLLIACGELKFSPDGKTILQRKIGYNLMPASGSSVVHRIVDKEAFEFSNNVDELHPLSVFDFLLAKSCERKQFLHIAVPRNIHTLGAQRNRRQLVSVLSVLYKRLQVLNDLVVPAEMLDIDF